MQALADCILIFCSFFSNHDSFTINIYPWLGIKTRLIYMYWHKDMYGRPGTHFFFLCLSLSNLFVGSFGYYEQDAKTLAGWGVDFVKTDNCNRPGQFTEQQLYQSNNILPNEHNKIWWLEGILIFLKRSMPLGALCSFRCVNGGTRMFKAGEVRYIKRERERGGNVTNKNICR